MKIAYLGVKGFPSRGGAERVVEAIVQRLAGRHEITVYCSMQYTTPEAVIDRVNFIRLPWLSGKYTRMTSLNFFTAWHAVIYGNYDLIHLHNIEASFILPILKLKYSVIATAHGRITQGSRWNKLAAAIMQSMEYPFVLLPHVATSVSLPDAKYLSKRYCRTIFYIPNGITTNPEVDIETAIQMLRSNQLPTNDYILFVAGRIIPLKGAHLLLEAFNRVKGAYHLLIVGDCSQSPKYSKQVKSMVDDRVTFIPLISSKNELFGVMNLSRFFVFPSITEAMSMVLLEAASLGVPIICSDISANSAVLSEYALYFRSGDADDLHEKLNWAINHPKKMKEMGLKAQAWVKIEFSWDVVAERYDRLYQLFSKKS